MGEPREEEGSLEDSLQDSVVREALEGGLDLRDYSKLVELLELVDTIPTLPCPGKLRMNLQLLRKHPLPTTSVNLETLHSSTIR